VQPVAHKTILTFGQTESELAKVLGNWEAALPEHIRVAYLPEQDGVRLRISACAMGKEPAALEMDRQYIKLRDILGRVIVGLEDTTLEQATGDLLRRAKASVAVAESCTGGSIAARFTANAGSSDFFTGGVVAYSNHLKTGILGVPKDYIARHGAVSQAVVEEMARGICRVSGCAYGIATSGIAGPGGGSADKPVGMVWLAVSAPDGVYSDCLNFDGGRKVIIRQAGSAAINKLRLCLLDALEKTA
jgi:nicotinamide-nucleotide amidase